MGLGKTFPTIAAMKHGKIQNHSRGLSNHGSAEFLEHLFYYLCTLLNVDAAQLSTTLDSFRLKNVKSKEKKKTKKSKMGRATKK